LDCVDRKRLEAKVLTSIRRAVARTAATGRREYPATARVAVRAVVEFVLRQTCAMRRQVEL